MDKDNNQNLTTFLLIAIPTFIFFLVMLPEFRVLFPTIPPWIGALIGSSITVAGAFAVMNKQKKNETERERIKIAHYLMIKIQRQNENITISTIIINRLILYHQNYDISKESEIIDDINKIRSIVDIDIKDDFHILIGCFDSTTLHNIFSFMSHNVILMYKLSSDAYNEYFRFDVDENENVAEETIISHHYNRLIMYRKCLSTYAYEAKITYDYLLNKYSQDMPILPNPIEIADEVVFKDSNPDFLTVTTGAPRPSDK